jgi:hypothetical protein
MSNSEFGHNPEELGIPKVEINEGYEEFVPVDFKLNPLSYFETHGANVKPGEVQHDETGRVKEDPTAVKDLPTWQNSHGEQIQTVGKRVNVQKGKVAEAGDPFYEYNVMEYVRSKNLPAPKTIARASEGSSHLIVMERVQGVRWTDRKLLKEHGYTKEDIEQLTKQAENKMAELKRKFDENGIIRGWKLKDMVFDIDFANKEIKSITPVDWERTKIQK